MFKKVKNNGTLLKTAPSMLKNCTIVGEFNFKAFYNEYQTDQIDIH